MMQLSAINVNKSGISSFSLECPPPFLPLQQKPVMFYSRFRGNVWVGVGVGAIEYHCFRGNASGLQNFRHLI